MKSLREALQKHRERPIDYRDPEYIERFLLDLGPTIALDTRIADAILRRDVQAEGSSSWQIADAEVRRLSETAQRIAWRDELAADRPEDCFCLGLGGHQPRYTQGRLKVYSEYCSCADGQRIKASQARELAEEWQRLETERAAKLFGKAQVPARFSDVTLESYPVSDRTRESYAAVKLWLDGPQEGPDEHANVKAFNAWKTGRKRSLLLHGPYGVGKTGLAIGILRLEINTFGGGLFFTVPTLLDHIRRTYGPNPIADEHEIVQAVKTTPFLVLDDLGAERVTEWVREKLFTIINHRHDEDLPTVFTSNLDMAELGQHIGERTTWRIVEMCQVIHVDGPNLRDMKGA